MIISIIPNGNVVKLFLDTNIFLRYFTADNVAMFEKVKFLLKANEEGLHQLATSTIVLTEVIYTLSSFYKQDKSSIEKHIRSILSIRSLLLVEMTDFRKAFSLYKGQKQKISDCLIITQVPKDCKLCSFDERLEKLIGKGRFILPGIVIA